MLPPSRSFAIDAVLRAQGRRLYLFLLERKWREAVVQAERHLVLFSTPERAVPEIVRAMMAAASLPPPSSPELEADLSGIGALRRTLLRRLAEGMRRGQRAGLLRPGNPAVAAAFLLRLVEQAARRRAPAHAVADLVLSLSRP